MKIALINAVYEFGSTGRMVMEIHRHLARREDESWVFCTNRSIPGQNVALIGNSWDQKIHAFLSRLLGLQGYFSTLATRRLVKQLKAIKPDIVHLHNLHANYINLPILLRYLAENDIATVLTLHDCWFFTGHCCHYTEDKCMAWLDGCNHCPALHKYNRSWFLDQTRKIYADKKRLFGAIPRLAVIGNSEWTTAQARMSFLKNAQIVERIYNWIDLNTFYPQDKSIVRKKLGLQNDDFVILGVSQVWSETKGLPIFTQIAEKFPQYKIILVGNMDGGTSLPQNIMCVGRTADVAELAAYYSAADVFVSASIQETFGLVSAEALACGTPIVVNNATANPELAGRGCGYVVDNDDIETYFRALEEIHKNGREHYSERCRSFAEEQFDAEKNIARYTELYKRLNT